MNKNFFTHDEYSALNEIVFENRNKEYGAYALRNEANAMLQKALFTGVALFAGVVFIPLIITNLKKEPQLIVNKGPFILKNIPEIDDRKIEKVTPIVIPPKQDVPQKTQSLTTPEPTRNPPVETTINQKVDDAIISTVTSPGESVSNPNQKIITVPVENTTPTVVTSKQNPDAISTIVDVEANFVGGIDGFRNKVVQNFDNSVVEDVSGEVVKAVVTFVVERDGTISNIKASGGNAEFNKEAEKVIKNIKGKWNPAKLNGQNVRSYFRFPISMQFE